MNGALFVNWRSWSLLALCWVSMGLSNGLCSESTSDSTVSLDQLNQQAKSYADHKQWGKAQQSYKEILKRRQKEYGSDDFRLDKPLSDVVRVTCIDGKCAATVPYLKQILQIRQKHFGPVHPLVATTLLLLGEAYEKMNDYENACAFFRQTAQMQATLTGKDSQMTIGTRLNTIRVLKEKGDYIGANKEVQECLTLIGVDKSGSKYFQNVLTDYQKDFNGKINPKINGRIKLPKPAQ